jgi:hypothetical protein
MLSPALSLAATGSMVWAPPLAGAAAAVVVGLLAAAIAIKKSTFPNPPSAPPVVPPNRFSYEAQQTVASVSPSSGSANGGTRIVIKGDNFPLPGSSDVVEVHVGDVVATNAEVTSANEIQATTPPGPEGAVHVSVITPYGTSAESDRD